ncbi:MAG: hypothetical protein ACOX6S_11725 [Clostridia bacterium]|jgi:hypothetical protein
MEQIRFNPEEHITKLPVRRKNKQTNQWELDYADYLEVKWRMVWFRDEHPEGTKTVIKDKIVDTAKRFAYFELEITDSKGNVEIGVGSETGDDFPDYIEKAYTKAYGRALAALGYGTQFAPELEEEERIVDSPVAGHNKATTKETGMMEGITEAQGRAIFAIYNSMGITEQEIKEIIKRRYNKNEGRSLTKQEASDLIDFLNHMKNQKHDTTKDINH